MNSKRVALSLCLFAVSYFCACSSTPPICRPENARNAGIASAMRGEDYNEAQGGICEDEDKSIFKNNYNAGYREGKQRLCDPANAEQAGLQTSQAGKAFDFSDSQYRICENPGASKFAYKKGYERGTEEFCADGKAQSAGDTRGSSGQPSDFSDTTYAICPKGRISKLKAAYEKGHRAGVEKFCTPTDADAKGMQDGSSGAEKSDIQTKYQICSAAKRSAIAKAYDQAYERGVNQFCTPANIDAEAVAQAQNASTPVLPIKYSRCFSRNPELTGRYSTTFNEERKKVIASRCTYQAGVAKGQADANRTNNKDTGMPDYCDTSLFSVFLSGYLEGWKQTKDRVCDLSAAYADGLKRGQTGSNMSYAPPPNCPPEYETALRQKFNEAYQVGMGQRAQPLGAAFGSGQPTCRSSLDCPSGSFCRDRGDGLRYCMGKGGRGAFCQSSLDCISGYMCRDQGGNIKICN